MADNLTDPGFLKAELAKPGRSQSALGRHMGLDPSSVNRMVSGARQMKAAELPLVRSYLQQTGAVTEQPQLTTFVQVVGVVEAGAWRDMLISHHEGTIPVVMDARGEDVFALKVVGPSMNLRYPDGSHVIARRWNGGSWPIGKNVIVQRTDAGNKVETTLKELVQGAGGLELWPRSTDPRHQTPVSYDEKDATVEIIGLVFASYRSEE